MNEKIVSREQIKNFAIILMLIDHIILIFPVFSGFIFESVDGLCHFTFITMTYLLVEGFFFTSSRKKYAKRLLVFALVSHHESLVESIGIEDWERFQRIVEIPKDDFETAPEKTDNFMQLDEALSRIKQYPGLKRIIVCTNARRYSYVWTYN